MNPRRVLSDLSLFQSSASPALTHNHVLTVSCCVDWKPSMVQTCPLLIVCKATWTPLAFYQEQLDSCINWTPGILKSSKNFRVKNIPFAFRQFPACTAAAINLKIYSDTVSQQKAVTNAFQSSRRSCVSMPWRHRPALMNVRKLRAPLSQGWLYRGVTHPLLAWTPTVFWCREEGTILPPSSFVFLLICLIQVVCVDGGWGCSTDEAKWHVSAFSSLTGGAQCHPFMFQASLKKTVRWKSLLLCKHPHGTGNTCFRKFQPLVYKMSISQDELPINIWKLSPSTYS